MGKNHWSSYDLFIPNTLLLRDKKAVSSCSCTTISSSVGMNDISDQDVSIIDDCSLVNFPPEIILHILSFLDLPDLAVLAQVVPALIHLTTDPVLHTYRLRIVSPSRVNHKLFGVSPQGHTLRPTLVDLVHRGVIKGLGIERRWRMGGYFYSLNSIVQYENMRSLSRRHASHVLAVQLRRRTINGTASNSLQVLCSTHVFPDVESSSLNVARSLLPIMRKLKWCLQRDRLAKVFKVSGVSVGIGAWLDRGDSKGRKVVQEGEKVRLAVCPNIRTKVGFYERLGRFEKALTQ